MGLPWAGLGVDTGSNPLAPDRAAPGVTRKATKNVSEYHHNVPCRHRVITGRLDSDDDHTPITDQEAHGCARTRPRARALATRTTKRLGPSSATPNKAGACSVMASLSSRTPVNCSPTATPSPPIAPPT